MYIPLHRPDKSIHQPVARKKRLLQVGGVTAGMRMTWGSDVERNAAMVLSLLFIFSSFSFVPGAHGACATIIHGSKLVTSYQRVHLRNFQVDSL